MYRRILVPCLISCPANSPCPAMRDGLTCTRIVARGCLLVDAEVLPVLSSFDSAASNIDARLGRRTAFPRAWTMEGIGGMAQVSEKNCCPYLCVLVVYICSQETYVHYS